MEDQMVTTIEKLMTRSQVARALDISPERVTQLARRGQLPHLRTDLGRLYDPADIEQLRRERAARNGQSETVSR